MLNTRKGTVIQIIGKRGKSQILEVLAEKKIRKAINYCELTGTANKGDFVIINTTATDLNLGTGGYDFVIYNENLEKPVGGEGHHVKLRYSPMQFSMQAEEEVSLNEATIPLNNIPVVACCLHSQIAPVAYAVKKNNPNSRIVYVMTDSAALGLDFSEAVHALSIMGLIDGTVTCGQAFGGSLEAVNIYSGLLLAYNELKADLIIAGQGPGNLGTHTQWGFSGMDQAIILNAVYSLNGKPICCTRMSSADKRERHKGISHHAITILSKATLGSSFVPLPNIGIPWEPYIQHQLSINLIDKIHTVEWLNIDDLYDQLLIENLPLNTMGRKPEDDPIFFKACLAVGMFASKNIIEAK